MAPVWVGHTPMWGAAGPDNKKGGVLRWPARLYEALFYSPRCVFGQCPLRRRCAPAFLPTPGAAVFECSIRVSSRRGQAQGRRGHPVELGGPLTAAPAPASTLPLPACLQNGHCDTQDHPCRLGSYPGRDSLLECPGQLLGPSGCEQQQAARQA
jgi:hypothetical protein